MAETFFDSKTNTQNSFLSPKNSLPTQLAKIESSKKVHRNNLESARITKELYLKRLSMASNLF